MESEHEHFDVMDNEEKLPQSSTHEDEGTAKNSDVEPTKCRRSRKGQYVKDGGHKGNCKVAERKKKLEIFQESCNS